MCIKVIPRKTSRYRLGADGTTHSHRDWTSQPRTSVESSYTTTIARLTRFRTVRRGSSARTWRAMAAALSAFSICCSSDQCEAPTLRKVSVIRPWPIRHSGAG